MTADARQPVPSTVRNIAAATVGGALEWYDLLVYAYVAPEIGRAFFPAEAPMVSTAIALGTFGVSYLARPLGGIFLGRYADRAGRRAGLLLVSVLMFVATAVITILPGYDRIGLAAPVILFAARLLQGFSAGGEFGSGLSFLAEQSPDRRGFFSSWQFASQGFAIMLAAGVTGLTAALVSGEGMATWGWRVPFAVGLAVGPAAYYIRAHVSETPEFMASGREPRAKGSIRVGQIVLGVAMLSLATACTYSLIFLPTLATGALGLGKSAAESCSVLNGAILFIAGPLFGWLGDRIGHVRLALAAAVAVAVSSVPLFALLDVPPALVSLIVAEATLSFVTAAYVAALSPCLTDLFPIESRTFSISMSYNIAVLAIGGFAPLGLATLMSFSSHHFVIGVYPAAVALIALSALVIRDRQLAAIGIAAARRPA